MSVRVTPEEMRRRLMESTERRSARRVERARDLVLIYEERYRKILTEHHERFKGD